MTWTTLNSMIANRMNHSDLTLPPAPSPRPPTPRKERPRQTNPTSMPTLSRDRPVVLPSIPPPASVLASASPFSGSPSIAFHRAPSPHEAQNEPSFEMENLRPLRSPLTLQTVIPPAPCIVPRRRRQRKARSGPVGRESWGRDGVLPCINIFYTITGRHHGRPSPLAAATAAPRRNRRGSSFGLRISLVIRTSSFVILYQYQRDPAMIMRWGNKTSSTDVLFDTR